MMYFFNADVIFEPWNIFVVLTCTRLILSALFPIFHCHCIVNFHNNSITLVVASTSLICCIVFCHFKNKVPICKISCFTHVSCCITLLCFCQKFREINFLLKACSVNWLHLQYWNQNVYIVEITKIYYHHTVW